MKKNYKNAIFLNNNFYYSNNDNKYRNEDEDDSQVLYNNERCYTRHLKCEFRPLYNYTRPISSQHMSSTSIHFHLEGNIFCSERKQ